MAFLTKEELKTVTTDEVVNLITGSDDSIVSEIIDESIDLMKSYLFRYYNVTAIFSAEGAGRSKIILKYLKDIVIHEVYIRRTKRINETAKLRYDEALLWLEKIAEAKIDLDLPRQETDNGDGTTTPDTFLKLGSRKTYQNHW